MTLTRKDWIVILTVVFILFLLSGCATKTEYKTITKVEYVYVTPSETMLEVSPIPKPMEISTYMSLPFDERETALTTYSIELMNQLKQCNGRLLSIREFIKR